MIKKTIIGVAAVLILLAFAPFAGSEVHAAML
jgi:hypothetical protein